MHSVFTDKEAEKQKLTEIYEKYRNRMYIIACRILKDPYLAEDAVHEAFVALSKNLGKIGDTDSIQTASYVIKAAKSRALNMARQKVCEMPTLISDEDAREDESTLDAICEKENYSYIVSAILSLGEKYRDVLSLYYLNELTVTEISHLLSRKESTVKQQLARGRRKLIYIIEKEALNDEK
ncbi:MAG: sigma-70 family RNA polymerase sigma factor [Clostridia bacterium]|nr:sigma-70 family RNA polymerase sigma factor [Clostridia bacterium]